MLSWSTDVHLDFVTPESEFYQHWKNELTQSETSGVLLTGDIADGRSIKYWLCQLAEDLQKPLYFVLGNHDYYHSSISDVRQALAALSHPHVHWLDHRGPIQLSPQLSLVGSGGWGDGRVGDFLTTPIRINDHRLIQDLTMNSREELLERLQTLGQEEAQKVRTQLNQVETDHIIVATHVPPFRESTWYQGRYGDWDWMPDFCCGAMGEVLLRYAQQYPAQTLNVYCGHSHGEGSYHPLPNLSIFTGKAEYSHPRVQGVINSQGRVQDADRYLQAELNHTWES